MEIRKKPLEVYLSEKERDFYEKLFFLHKEKDSDVFFLITLIKDSFKRNYKITFRFFRASIKILINRILIYY